MTSGSRPRGCLVSPIMRRRHDGFNPFDRKVFANRMPASPLAFSLLGLEGARVGGPRPALLNSLSDSGSNTPWLSL